MSGSSSLSSEPARMRSSPVAVGVGEVLVAAPEVGAWSVPPLHAASSRTETKPIHPPRTRLQALITLIALLPWPRSSELHIAYAGLCRGCRGRFPLPHALAVG